MKFKATAKEMRDNYNYIIEIGYCEAQRLLKYENPIAYSCGVYGWNCDYYEVVTDDYKRVLISTGYRNLLAKNSKCSYELIKKYNNKATKIIDSKLSYKSQKTKLDKLVKAFVTQCIYSQKIRSVNNERYQTHG